MTSPNTPDSELREDRELWLLAQNIVNQLGDLWKVPVYVRQATNDECDDFVMALIDQHIQAKVVEAQMETVSRIEQSLKSHTVPEGRYLLDRSYVQNTINFERGRLKAQTKSGEEES